MTQAKQRSDGIAVEPMGSNKKRLKSCLYLPSSNAVRVKIQQ